MASGQRQGLHTLRLGHKIPRCAASSRAGSLFPPLQSQAQNLPAAALSVCSPASAGVSSRRAVTQGHAALPNANMGQKSPAQPVPECCSPRQMLPPEQQLLGAHGSAQRAPTGPGPGGMSGGGAGEHVVRGQPVKAAGGEETGLFCGAASISEGQGAGASQPRLAAVHPAGTTEPSTMGTRAGSQQVPEPHQTLLCRPCGAVAPPESLPNPAEPGQPALGSSGTPVRLLETSAWGDQAVGSPRPAAQRGAGSVRLHGQLGQRTWAGPTAGPGWGEGPVPEEHDRPRAPEPLTQCSLPSLATAGPRGLGTGCHPGRGV